MRKLQSQGVHHITIVSADRLTSIGFWEGVLGFIVEQPNLDNESENRFEPPSGHTHTDVPLEAHELRVERGDYNFDRVHLADAIEALAERSRGSPSEDRSPQDTYQ